MPAIGKWQIMRKIEPSSFDASSFDRFEKNYKTIKKRIDTSIYRFANTFRRYESKSCRFQIIVFFIGYALLSTRRDTGIVVVGPCTLFINSICLFDFDICIFYIFGKANPTTKSHFSLHGR